MVWLLILNHQSSVILAARNYDETTVSKFCFGLNFSILLEPTRMDDIFLLLFRLVVKVPHWQFATFLVCFSWPGQSGANQLLEFLIVRLGRSSNWCLKASTRAFTSDFSSLVFVLPVRIYFFFEYIFFLPRSLNPFFISTFFFYQLSTFYILINL